MSTKPQSDTPRTDAQPQTWESRGLATSYMTVPRDLARTLERELAAAQERIAELEAELAQMAEFMLARELAIRLNEQPPAPQFLERPDAPGWWWRWDVADKEWTLIEVRNPQIWVKTAKTLWLPATPPPAPKNEEGQG